MEARGGNGERGQGEDRMLQEGERVLGGSSGLTDSREAPSYANYLAFVPGYLLVYIDATSASSCDLYESIRVRARAKRTRCACVVYVLSINRVEFQGVNPLFHVVSST